jgi:hypothetical protein
MREASRFNMTSTERDRQLAEHIVNECFATGCSFNVGLCAELLAESRAAERDAARGDALREIAKLECPMCAQGNVPETMESTERGTYYWHHFGNLSRECGASKIQAILALDPSAVKAAEPISEALRDCRDRAAEEHKR